MSLLILIASIPILRNTGDTVEKECVIVTFKSKWFYRNYWLLLIHGLLKLTISNIQYMSIGQIYVLGQNVGQVGRSFSPTPPHSIPCRDGPDSMVWR